MIHMNDVHVTYPGGMTALHPSSLHFRQGEFTVLLGASGAGKSTLLRCLNQLTPPSGGSITVEGLGSLDNRRRLYEHRKRTGMIFQQHQLIGRQSALANVLLGRIGYHSALRSMFPLPLAERRIALECLERVGLLHKALERADRLSGGQQQRVGIARALAQQPRLMLGDEPVASLDPATSHNVLAQLQRIGREDGITTVVSLHQVDLAQAYADRVIGLAHGRVVFDGAPSGLTPAVLQAIYQQSGHGVAMPVSTPVTPSTSVYQFATIED
ncbi:MAG: phosphonate ABC transporter ATP-binding protein [Gammaproteobacteria bacterium]|nr:phosphonate ABC transporter ATP-binding protein [Gammaproteobacteria bacterium]